jgi:uncharacterized protein YdaU (DUF1376 family)
MSAPYIPLYIDDYDAATAHLSPEEDGIYGRLLRLCWRTPGCSIPNDPAWIARKIRLTAADFDRIAKPVIDEFFTLTRGRLIQRRLKREWDNVERKKSARKIAGKKGGIAKALKVQEKPASNATILLPDTRAFPEPYPEPERETPKVPVGDASPPSIVLRKADVEAVWDLTPRSARERTSRADIEKALQSAARRGHAPSAVIAGLAGYYASPDATKDGGQFAKGAHRMIQNDRWQAFADVPAADLTPADPNAVWRKRVKGFVSGARYWNTNDWGHEPGRPGCIVPPEIIAEFQPQEQAA